MVRVGGDLEKVPEELQDRDVGRAAAKSPVNEALHALLDGDEERAQPVDVVHVLEQLLIEEVDVLAEKAQLKMRRG